MDRVEQLRAFIEGKPGDPFPRYALALELRSRGELEESWVAFQQLFEADPEYLPAFLHAGGVLVDLGRKGAAADVFRRGIEVADRKGDRHAREELESALAGSVAD